MGKGLLVSLSRLVGGIPRVKGGACGAERAVSEPGTGQTTPSIWAEGDPRITLVVGEKPHSLISCEIIFNVRCRV